MSMTSLFAQKWKVMQILLKLFPFLVIAENISWRKNPTAILEFSDFFDETHVAYGHYWLDPPRFEPVEQILWKASSWSEPSTPFLLLRGSDPQTFNIINHYTPDHPSKKCTTLIYWGTHPPINGNMFLFLFLNFSSSPRKKKKSFFLRTEAKLCDKALLPTTKGSQRVNSQR